MTISLPRINFPELFFGLVAPIGTIFEPTVNSISEELVAHGYSVISLSVTDLFDMFANAISPNLPLDKSTRYLRYKTYIEYGNQLRDATGDNSILALASMYQISLARSQITPQLSPPQKTAYLLRQFKRPEEIDLLRSVYGDQFFQISIYSTRPARVSNLADLFSKDAKEPTPDAQLAFAHEVVQIDQDEGDITQGQRLKKTFHDADLIVNANLDDEKVTKQIKRFVRLVFGANAESPTKYEYGMKLAKSAALRSIDLSRQVGAAIFDEKNQIISLGSNEVPKAGGGTYWSDDDHDAREYTKKLDSNDERKKELLSEILEISGIPKQKKEELLKDLSKFQMMDALEYGRVIHAEMSALTDASRKGLAVKDSTLYCTTFPCHLCAKHIVSAGVKKVVFLEPYPKSLVSRLHQDSINVENMDRGKYAKFEEVIFEHFSGITPRKFDLLFARGKRKDDDGKYKKYINIPPQPVMLIRDVSYLVLESTLVKNTFKQLIPGVS